VTEAENTRLAQGEAADAANVTAIKPKPLIQGVENWITLPCRGLATTSVASLITFINKK
jgi:hypothetical protein